MRKFVLFIFVCFCLCSSTDIWISFSEDGLKYRAAVFSKALINAFGDDTVSAWLQNKTTIRVVFTTDSLGYFQKITRLSSSNYSFESRQIDKIEDEIIKLNVRIPLCFERIPEVDSVRAYELATQSIRSRANSNIGITSFPPSRKITKIEDLKKEIEKDLNLTIG